MEVNLSLLFIYTEKIFIGTHSTGQVKNSIPARCGGFGFSMLQPDLLGGTPLAWKPLEGFSESGICLPLGRGLPRAGTVNAGFESDSVPPEPTSLQSLPISLRVKAAGIRRVSGSTHLGHLSLPSALSSPLPLTSSLPSRLLRLVEARVFAPVWTAPPLDVHVTLQVLNVTLLHKNPLTTLPQTATSPRTLPSSFPLLSIMYIFIFVLFSFSLSFHWNLSPRRCRGALCDNWRGPTTAQCKTPEEWSGRVSQKG